MTNRELENMSDAELYREIGRTEERIRQLDKDITFWGRMLKISLFFTVLFSGLSFYFMVR